MKKLIILSLVSVVSFVLGGCMDGCRNKKTWAQTTLSNKKVVAIYLSGEVKTFEEAQEFLEVVPKEDVSIWVNCLLIMDKSTNFCPPGHLIWIRFEDKTMARLVVHFDHAGKVAFVEDPLQGQFGSKILYEVYDAISEIPEGGFK